MTIERKDQEKQKILIQFFKRKNDQKQHAEHEISKAVFKLSSEPEQIAGFTSEDHKVDDVTPEFNRTSKAATSQSLDSTS